MPRKPRLPKYRLNKTTGRALVKIDGVTHWLGRHGTPESREKYDRLIAEWLSGGRGSATPAAADPAVVELIDRFWSHVETFYRRKDGSKTSEVDNFRNVLRPLKALYGSTPAAAFGPKALRAVRQRMIEMKWCRSSINKEVSRPRQMFKWAASQELIPPTVHLALATVPGLRRGKTDAHEADPVRPVPDADVDAIRAHVSRQVWAMVQIQRLTGMRPGEVCIMRTCDVDRSGKVWAYRPADHKTAHFGHGRTAYIGPKAQGVLEEWFPPDLTAYLFQPAEAEAVRRERMHEDRKRDGTPLSQGNAPGTNRKRRPKWKPGDRYDVAAYRRAIERGCERAFGMPDELRKDPKRPQGDAATPAALASRAEDVKRVRAAAAEWRRLQCWHPHQLRHNAATFLRKEYGLEAAQVILGHRTLSVTEIYAAKNVEAAKRIMGEVG